MKQLGCLLLYAALTVFAIDASAYDHVAVTKFANWIDEAEGELYARRQALQNFRAPFTAAAAELKKLDESWIGILSNLKASASCLKRETTPSKLRVCLEQTATSLGTLENCEWRMKNFIITLEAGLLKDLPRETSERIKSSISTRIALLPKIQASLNASELAIRNAIVDLEVRAFQDRLKQVESEARKSAECKLLATQLGLKTADSFGWYSIASFRKDHFGMELTSSNLEQALAVAQRNMETCKETQVEINKAIANGRQMLTVFKDGLAKSKPQLYFAESLEKLSAKSKHPLIAELRASRFPGRSERALLHTFWMKEGALK